MHDLLDERPAAFYRHAMDVLRDARVPFLVGGAFALQRHAGITRDTRDFDLFIRPSDVERALAAFEAAGDPTELTAPHWLAKIQGGDLYVDLIFSSGNGVATVDDGWFEHAVEAEILGAPALLIPPEEMVWSKAFVMERERFDGADVLHVFHRQAERLDWDRLLARFADHWRVLLAHLVLYGFAYPTDRARVPPRIVRELIARLEAELTTAGDGDALARGTLLSRTQYRPDVKGGYGDARLLPPAELTEDELEQWDEAGAPETGEAER
ncbi:MAG: nucleotidyltransferase [Candidatus Limnocylindria bacterium]